MGSQSNIIRLLLKVGIVLYPAFYLLDLATYPDQKIPILLIRAGVTLYLLLVYLIFGKYGENWSFPLILSAFLAPSLGISFICVLSGEGFASSYFAGILEIVLLSMALYTLPLGKYALLICLVVGQHFVLNWFIPWEYKDLLSNVYTLGVISLVVLLLHNIIYHLTKENDQLKRLLPICARCKKIRDDEGLWHQVDEYINQHSDIEFTHGICPECAEKLYGKFVS